MGPQLADLIAKGDVQLEMRHLPLYPESIPAVEAVECAGEQGYWWAMHDKIFDNQARGTAPRLMKEYAREMGLDTQAFNQCMDSHRYVQLAQDAQAAALQMGVQGTPTFFINGRPLELTAWDDLLKAVKEELSKP